MCRWKITILSWWFSMAMLDFQRLHWNTFDHVWSSWNARLWFPSWQPCPRMSAAAMLLLSRIRYPTRYPHCGLLCSPMRDKKRAFSMTCKYTAEYWGEDLQLAYFRWTFDSWDASTRSPGYRFVSACYCFTFYVAKMPSVILWRVLKACYEYCTPCMQPVNNGSYLVRASNLTHHIYPCPAVGNFFEFG